MCDPTVHVHRRLMVGDVFSLEFETDPGWLLVTARGFLDEESDRLIDERVMEECRQRGLDAVLIDIRAMHGRLGIAANHEAARDFGHPSPTGC